SSERSNATLVRFNADGSNDNNFGNLGLVTTEIEGYSSEIKEITEQTDKKILIAGNIFDSSTKGNASFTVIRYLENGTIDSTFGTNGITITNLGYDAKANSIALQNDNKIVLGGILYKLVPPYYFVTLARYSGDGTVITRIKHWIRNHIIHWQDIAGNVSYYSIEKSIHANSGFVQIAHIPANSNNIYSYADNKAVQGNSYYRISAVSTDGNTISSDIVSDARATTTAAISIAPNPVNNFMTIKALSPGTKYEVRITNSNGNLIAAKELSNLSFYNWNVSSLNKGVYYINVASVDNNVSLKFVKE
ncbi:MAG TPA: T9SS type A sorting domain-containing protein, partial [Parafilimonas sp.]